MERSSPKAVGPGCLHPGHGLGSRGSGFLQLPRCGLGAGSGGRLQDGAEDVGGEGEEKGGGPVTG